MAGVRSLGTTVQHRRRGEGERRDGRTSRSLCGIGLFDLDFLQLLLQSSRIDDGHGAKWWVVGGVLSSAWARVWSVPPGRIYAGKVIRFYYYFGLTQPHDEIRNSVLARSRADYITAQLIDQ